MSAIAYVNGEFVPEEAARISIDDRGFVFADALYEVIKCYQHRPFRLREHLARLLRGAQEISLPLALNERGFKRAIDGLLARNRKVAESILYVQVTRGPGPRVHAFPSAPRPTTILGLSPAPVLDPVAYRDGVSVITVPDARWDLCHLKSVGLLVAVLAKQAAADAGASDAVFVRSGVLTEGASANLFGVRHGRLVTHPEGPHILGGITRQVVLEIAEELGIPVELRGMRAQEVDSLDEAFLTGTGTEILPIASIDGKEIGQEGSRTVTRALQDHFWHVTRGTSRTTMSVT